ncbi:MAG TPA: HEAT repeat domain-containing protein [Acidobacteriaceae bacterium]|nr:HEAT repeat domain-containing protein [Acidobacteriaceae bacterium]
MVSARHHYRSLHCATVILLLIGLGMGPGALGIAVSGLDLQTLCRSSDLIVVGRVGSFTKAGQEPVTVGYKTELADLKEAQVDVLAVLKGGESAATISVDVPVFLPAWGSAELDGIQAPSTRLLFLRKRADGGYEVTDAHHPSLPGVAVSSLDGSPLEQVAGVECQVIADDSVPQEDRLEAMRILRRVDAPCILPTLRQIATENPGMLRFSAETELMYRGDTPSLRKSIADALSENPDVPGYIQRNILSGIRDGKQDPSAIPLLEPLMRSDDVEARVAGAYALKYIGTKECEPLLRSLLSDSDQHVRYIAAIALADIAGIPEMHPSVDEFRKHEDKYISYWK